MIARPEVTLVETAHSGAAAVEKPLVDWQIKRSAFAAENELLGGDILPGFRCQIAEFFEGI